jgi:hypothetical protein
VTEPRSRAFEAGRRLGAALGLLACALAAVACAAVAAGLGWWLSALLGLR